MAQRKVYEFVGMNNVHVSTQYCGVTVKMDFKDGNTIEGKNARLTTINAFVQDAIEHDSRFGSSIRLYSTFNTEDAGDYMRLEGLSSATTATTTTTTTPQPKKPTKTKKAKSEATEGATAVESVKTINDAIEYFATLGEAVESDEQIAALKEKHNVTFPNLA